MKKLLFSTIVRSYNSTVWISHYGHGNFCLQTNELYQLAAVAFCLLVAWVRIGWCCSLKLHDSYWSIIVSFLFWILRLFLRKVCFVLLGDINDEYLYNYDSLLFNTFWLCNFRNVEPYYFVSSTFPCLEFFMLIIFSLHWPH